MLHDRRHGSVYRFAHALFDDHGVGAGGHVLHAFPDQRLRQQGGGGGAVAGRVVGLGGNFLYQLGAHVLERVLQLDILGDGHAVVGDKGRAEFFIQHHIAALGPQGDFDGIRQLVDPQLQRLAGFFAIYDLLCHNNSLLFKKEKFTLQSPARRFDAGWYRSRRPP